MAALRLRKALAPISRTLISTPRRLARVSAARGNSVAAAVVAATASVPMANAAIAETANRATAKAAAKAAAKGPKPQASAMNVQSAVRAVRSAGSARKTTKAVPKGFPAALGQRSSAQAGNRLNSPDDNARDVSGQRFVGGGGGGAAR